MNSTQAYYVLELKPGASKKEVKTAFKRLSLKYHPDKNPENKAAEDLFKEVSNAYRLLERSAPEERIRDVGEARAKRAAQATGPIPTEEKKEPVGEVFGIFNFGKGLFGQIVDAAKKKGKNQK